MNLIATLEEIRSYLHSRADVDRAGVPNQELRLQGELEEAIAELGAAQIIFKP